MFTFGDCRRQMNFSDASFNEELYDTVARSTGSIAAVTLRTIEFVNSQEAYLCSNTCRVKKA